MATRVGGIAAGDVWKGVASADAPRCPIDCSWARRLSKSGSFAAEMMGNLVHRRLCCLPVTYEKAGARMDKWENLTFWV